MKALRNVYIVLSGLLILALALTFPLPSQLLTLSAITLLLLHRWFRAVLAKKERISALASIALSLSATLVVISSLAVGALLFVRIYDLFSIKFWPGPVAARLAWLSCAAFVVVAWVLFKPKGKMPERILVVSGACLVLWLLTWHWGQDQVRQDAVQAILKRYPSAQDYTDKNFVMGLDKYPVYTAKTGAPVPLIVWRESGVAYGELGGDGSTVWYLWLFGLKIRLITSDRWIA